MKTIRPHRTLVPVLILAGLVFQMIGCEVDSYFDPSKTGRFEHMPTTIPILDRIDVIEQEDSLWGQTTSVMPEDLIPGGLSYTIAPGDVVTVQIFELYSPTQWHSTSGQVDAGGFYRIPEIGDVQAAGMTAQNFEERVTQLLDEKVMRNPLVDVIIETSSGFRYTMYGAISGPGMYTLQTPDLRLLDALAIAGGTPLATKRVYVIREVPLSDAYTPDFERPGGSPTRQESTSKPQIDIEDLINEMDDSKPGVSPGAFWQEGDPLIDIDEVIPTQRGGDQPAIDIDDVSRGRAQGGSNDAFIYDEQRGEWVRVGPRSGINSPAPGKAPLVIERVIAIPFQQLKRGDNSFNVVIRPNDRIYVEESPEGVVYLDGEVLRPGVYNLPRSGGRLTLSRLIAAAGGFGALAIPNRVDLTRVVGTNREATIRLDLKAIRNRTEPDVMLKPDDHVIVGTNFWATPLAVIRNGFRATYGFGFLLDRNFGNDVFGAPPTNSVN